MIMAITLGMVVNKPPILDTTPTTVGSYRKIVPVVHEPVIKPKLVQESQSKPRKKIEPSDTTIIIVLATAYAPTGNLTRTETVPVEGRTIAVDPNVIPLGTEVWIEGWGTFIAEDTGGLIKGNRIDIFMDLERECVEFGVKHLKIKFKK